MQMIVEQTPMFQRDRTKYNFNQ